MRTIWIVVADAGRAQILSKLEGTGGTSIVEQLDNPLGRAHNVDLVTDRPGRMEKHSSSTRSAMEPRTDPHEEKAIEFAHELNQILDAAATRGDFDLLAIAAPSHFLGLLRQGMSPASKRRLVRSMAMDLTKLTIVELEDHLGDLLQFHHTVAAD